MVLGHFAVFAVLKVVEWVLEQFCAAEPVDVISRGRRKVGAIMILVLSVKPS